MATAYYVDRSSWRVAIFEITYAKKAEIMYTGCHAVRTIYPVDHHPACSTRIIHGDVADNLEAAFKMATDFADSKADNYRREVIKWNGFGLGLAEAQVVEEALKATL